jgi:hypothetical protein
MKLKEMSHYIGSNTTTFNITIDYSSGSIQHPYRTVYYTPYTNEQLESLYDIEDQMWYGTRGWSAPVRTLNHNIKIL